ncbi:hypothetical protein TrVE_jg9160 [Triparma verrucosa]|uniref:Uncharacterized protein n=1 Tax=Triparma verrucosa TaxID=1606542 RepID=A0A9W7F0Y1_9STRA|nr:hypothetical protein TrVE_jg9160 [Triparma verrucosa]
MSTPSDSFAEQDANSLPVVVHPPLHSVQPQAMPPNLSALQLWQVQQMQQMQQMQQQMYQAQFMPYSGLPANMNMNMGARSATPPPRNVFPEGTAVTTLYNGDPFDAVVVRYSLVHSEYEVMFSDGTTCFLAADKVGASTAKPPLKKPVPSKKRKATPKKVARQPAKKVAKKAGDGMKTPPPSKKKQPASKKKTSRSTTPKDTESKRRRRNGQSSLQRSINKQQSAVIDFKNRWLAIKERDLKRYKYYYMKEDFDWREKDHEMDEDELAESVLAGLHEPLPEKLEEEKKREKKPKKPKETKHFVECPEPIEETELLSQVFAAYGEEVKRENGFYEKEKPGAFREPWDCEACLACVGEGTHTRKCRKCVACKAKDGALTICHNKMCLFEKWAYGIS